MPNTYYDSELTGEQIEAALQAIDGVIANENNGKLLAIENGKIVAKSASEWTDAPVLEPVTITQNGTTTPPSGVDGFNSVTVAVPGAGNIEPITITENGSFAPPSGVDGYAPITVNVSGGGSGDYNYEQFILSQADIKAAVDAGATSSNYWYPRAPLPMLNITKERCDETIGVESSGDNPYYKSWTKYTENMYIFIRPIPKTANRVCIDCCSTGSGSYPYSVIAFRNKPYSGTWSAGMSNAPSSWTNFTKTTRTEYGITYDILGGASLSSATSIPVSDFENQDIVEEITLTSGVNGYQTRQIMKFDVSSFNEDTYLSWYHVGLYDKVYQIWWE